MRGHLRKIFFAVIVILGLVLLAILSRHRIHLADFTWSKFKFALSQANGWLLLLAVLAIYACYAVRAVRWQRFSRYLGPSDFLDVYTGTIMGFAAMFVLGRPGEVVRPLLLARKTRLPVASMFGILLLERLFDFAAAVALAIISLLIFSGSLSDAGANTDWVDGARTGGELLLGLLLTLILILVYFRLHGAGALERRLQAWHTAGGWKGWFATGMDGFSQGLQAIRTIPDLLLALGYTAAHWALVTLAYLWVAQAFQDAFPHTYMNFPGAMLLLAITLVGAALQLPGVGGGAQVASFIALTTIFQVEQEPAAVVAVVLWLVTFAVANIGGIPLLIHEGLSMGELRKLAKAEVAAEEAGEHVVLEGVAWRTRKGHGREGSAP